MCYTLKQDGIGCEATAKLFWGRADKRIERIGNDNVTK